MVAPLAGVTQLVKASPKVKAKNAVWRVKPTISASGAMIGIEIAACPELDGSKMFNDPPTINKKAIILIPPLKPLLMEVKKSKKPVGFCFP